MAEPSKITVARFDGGLAVRIEGSGSMTESPVVHGFACEVLKDSSRRLIVDLSACTYLDSTFLGGLVSLFKRHGAEVPARFAIFAPGRTRQVLFAVSRLDSVLPFASEMPELFGTHFPLETKAQTSREDFAAYIVDCHRRLAELGGAESKDFDRVADAIERDLRARRG